MFDEEFIATALLSHEGGERLLTRAQQ